MEQNLNGTGLDGNVQQQKLSSILEALHVVHSAASSNGQRREANIYLEVCKTDKDAPHRGFSLGSDRSQDPVVRYYGLSLLEHALKYLWYDYNDQDAMAIKEWVIRLARDIDAADPQYLRNKIALLWIDLAKRIWGNEWLDMDEMLVQLWSASSIHKEFVLTVLETISEDVFNSEDSMAALRGQQLSKACVEIFTPAPILQHHFPNRETSAGVRFGEEGWFARISPYLGEALATDIQNDTQQRVCILKALATLRVAMGWAIPKALISAHSVLHASNCLAAPNTTIQLVRREQSLAPDDLI